MTGRDSTRLTCGFAMACFLAVAAASRALATDRPERIDLTAEPLITLPFGLQWTHSPLEAVELLKRIEGVVEVEVTGHHVTRRNVMVMSEEETRDHLVSGLTVQSHEHWEGPVASRILHMEVRPIMIQRIACTATLHWDCSPGLILVDPGRVPRVKSDREDEPGDILWPVYLARLVIRSLEGEPVPEEAVAALRRSMLDRYPDIIRRAVIRRARFLAQSVAEPEMAAFLGRLVETREYQNYVRACVDYMLRESPSDGTASDNRLRSAGPPLYDIAGRFAHQYPTLRAGFDRAYHAITAVSPDTRASERFGTFWHANGGLRRFGIEFGDGLTLFDFRSQVNGGISVEYRRSPEYHAMLLQAVADFERLAKERADAKLRESRKDARDHTSDL